MSPFKEINSIKTINPVILAEYITAKIGACNHLKLQKLVYYIESWHLAIIGVPLIDDEFEAWPHGPVSRKLWKSLSSMSILYKEVKTDQPKKIINLVETILNSSQLDLIKDVLLKYGNQSSYYLECLTHGEQPWIDARKNLAPNEYSTNIISKETMKNFYSEMLYGQKQK